MPGRRSVARERAHHARIAPHRFRSLYALLATYLPDHERALVGQAAILAFLHANLGMRRSNGGPLTWRMVLRWHRDHDFPLLLGGYRYRIRTPSVASSFMITAWMFSRFANDEIFRVPGADKYKGKGRRPRETGVGSGNWKRSVAAVYLDKLAG